jgi:uncharacterized small protein (DUF1192 family)
VMTRWTRQVTETEIRCSVLQNQMERLEEEEIKVSKPR